MVPAVVERLQADPQPASPTDPRLVDGDDVLSGAVIDIYAKQFWPYLAVALAAAEAGDYSVIRGEAVAACAREPGGAAPAREAGAGTRAALIQP
jgi:hypothetical protein